MEFIIAAFSGTKLKDFRKLPKADKAYLEGLFAQGLRVEVRPNPFTQPARVVAEAGVFSVYVGSTKVATRSRERDARRVAAAQPVVSPTNFVVSPNFEVVKTTSKGSGTGPKRGSGTAKKRAASKR